MASYSTLMPARSFSVACVVCIVCVVRIVCGACIVRIVLFTVLLPAGLSLLQVPGSGFRSPLLPAVLVLPLVLVALYKFAGSLGV